MNQEIIVLLVGLTVLLITVAALLILILWKLFQIEKHCGYLVLAAYDFYDEDDDDDPGPGRVVRLSDRAKAA